MCISQAIAVRKSAWQFRLFPAKEAVPKQKKQESQK